MGHARWWLPSAVHAVLGLLGATLAWLQRGSVLASPGPPQLAETRDVALLLGLGLAVLVALITVVATRWLVARTRWARALCVNLRGALLGAGTPRLLLLACGTAISEELFFRAALVPVLGVLGSAALFGVLHVSDRASYLGWMTWAGVMGVVFGLLFVASGSLLPPIVAHAAINYGNMQYLCSHDPRSADLAGFALQQRRSRRV